MLKIKRFGKQISNVHISYQLANKLDWDKYALKLKKYIQEKVVYILKTNFVGWHENPVIAWFEKHYQELGFEKIIPERSIKYMKLKETMKFFGYPDFLVFRKGQYLRLEIECFSSDYLYHQHKKNYADIVLCVDETKELEGPEVISLRKFYGCREIIIDREIAEFLYLYDEEFKKDYDGLVQTDLKKCMANMFRDEAEELRREVEKK